MHRLKVHRIIVAFVKFITFIRVFTFIKSSIISVAAIEGAIDYCLTTISDIEFEG